MITRMNRLLWLLACTLLVGAGCTESAAPKPGPGGPRPARVEVALARDGSVTEGWEFLGQVEAALSAELAAAAAGHVLSVSVREGDRVKKGQALVTLESAKIRAELAAARAAETGLAAELEQAEKQAERAKKLAYPTISEPERERFELAAATARSQLAVKRADIRRLEAALADHRITAPFAGVVRSRMVDPGAWVSVGQPVLGLVSLDDLEVQVDVSAELGAGLRVGDEAALIRPGARPAGAANEGGDTGNAVITGVVPALDPATRTMRVRLEPEPRPAWLIAGMAVDVRFAVEVSTPSSTAADGGAVLVPRDAVIRGPVSSRVIVVRDGVAASVEVEVLAAARSEILVRGEGIAPGVQVVIRGNERLRPGQPVEVASSGSSGSSGAGGPGGSSGAGAGDREGNGAADGGGSGGDEGAEPAPPKAK